MFSFVAIITTERKLYRLQNALFVINMQKQEVTLTLPIINHDKLFFCLSAKTCCSCFWHEVDRQTVSGINCVAVNAPAAEMISAFSGV